MNISIIYLLTKNLRSIFQLGKYGQNVDAESVVNPPDVPDDLLFVKQYIPNACGTIALLHAIANNTE